MPYSPFLVKPMREELTDIGFTELLTAADVDKQMERAAAGLTLVAINSVKGIAAGMARPAARIALENTARRPDRLLTVFANQDLEAVARLRTSYLPDIPPSDPSFAVFKDGELVYFIPDYRIEARDAEAVAADLEAVFTEFG